MSRTLEEPTQPMWTCQIMHQVPGHWSLELKEEECTMTMQGHRITTLTLMSVSFWTEGPSWTRKLQFYHSSVLPPCCWPPSGPILLIQPDSNSTVLSASSWSLLSSLSGMFRYQLPSLRKDFYLGSCSHQLEVLSPW